VPVLQVYLKPVEGLPLDPGWTMHVLGCPPNVVANVTVDVGETVQPAAA